MENATKALLIAAAVLIAILIISLTLVIYRQGSEAVGNADLSEAQTAQFNGKFTVYEGAKESTAQVNALLQSALSHNQNEKQAGTARYVTVYVTDKAGTKTRVINSSSSSYTKITGNYYYAISCTYSKGLVTTINVTYAK